MTILPNLNKNVNFKIKIRFIFVTIFLWVNAFILFAQVPDLNSKSRKGAQNSKFYLGADLSYVNELEHCGGRYFVDGKQKDPFQIFAEKGASIARFRLWHSPDWTNYSTLKDVKLSIKRAREKKMQILLDFHYSDTWTDPSRQNIPKAWANIQDQSILGDSVYNYTRNVLLELEKEGLLPEFVQVGNEINAEILQSVEPAVYPIRWERNIALLNRGIGAVNQVSKERGRRIETILHIAQPENASPWFTEAKRYGIQNFDWIGLSYYSQWSSFDLSQLSAEIKKLKTNFGKRVMVVECGYPNSLENADSANNLLDTISQLPGFGISISDQKRFMVELTKAVFKGGGEGVVYWEPAWISTSCRTQWAKGSHWDNATFFNSKTGNSLPVFDFFTFPYE
jgi:arabinogalactan endo-1,4-beta-galactosidase